MYVDSGEYCLAVKELMESRIQLKSLQNDNQLLAEELLKQRQLVASLTRNNLALEEQLHQQYKIAEQDQSRLSRQLQLSRECCEQVKHTIENSQKEQKNYLDAKLEELNVQSLVELKQLKISNTQTRIEAYQLSNFVSKIKKLFITSTGSKEELSLNELVKCVKSLLQEKSEATKSTVRKNCKQNAK